MNCPLCLSLAHPAPSGEYVRCSSCGVVRTRYNYDSCQYNAQYCINYQQYALSPINQSLNLCRLGLAARFMNPGRYTYSQGLLLDIGCCVGEFIRFAERHYLTVGFEPNKEAVQVARRRVASRVTDDITSLVKEQKFTVITMFDVLEHIEDLHGFLCFLVDRLLAPGGHVIVTTPNVEPQEDLSSAWKHYKPKEHLWLHTEKSLEFAFSQVGMVKVYVGFEESDIRPDNPNKDIITFVARKPNV